MFGCVPGVKLLTMQNIDLIDCIAVACGFFAVTGVVGFVYESWRAPLAPIKNIDISDELK
jgi:hypothetical protein